MATRQKVFKKNVRKARDEKKKELTVDEITVDLVESETKVTVLKKWGKYLRVPNLNTYSTKNIPALKRELIRYILKEVVPGDQELLRDLDEIMKFLKAYQVGKEIALTGDAGKEFLGLWNTLPDKDLFVRDFFDVNMKGAKLNALDALKWYISSQKNVPREKTRGEILREILRQILQNIPVQADDTYQKFVDGVLSLDQDRRLLFASRVLQWKKSDPERELRIELEKSTEQLTLRTKVLQVPGFRKVSTAIELKTLEKCTMKWAKERIVISPSENCPPNLLGKPRDTGEGGVPWFDPADPFFALLCMTNLTVESNQLIAKGPERYSFRIGRIGKDQKIAKLSGVDIRKLIDYIEVGNVFSKVKPYWVLNEPLNASPPEVINEVARQIDVWSPKIITPLFLKEFADLKARSTTLLVYIGNVFLFFAPIVLSRITTKSFSLVSKIISQRISSKEYASMTLEEKVPELSENTTVNLILNYVKGTASLLIDGVSKDRPMVFPVIEDLQDFKDLHEKCPELKDVPLDDIIYRNGRCEKLVIQEVPTNPKKTIESFEIKYPKLSKEFDDYFGRIAIYANPVNLIENILAFEVTQKCPECTKSVADGISSVIDRSDGSTLRINFCDYTCMLKYDFQPFASVDEVTLEDESSPSIASIIASI